MTTFEYLSVALSFVIGLGVTYLLTSFVSLYRERRKCRPDWVPILWAFYVFVFQVQYWWAIYSLAEMETWSLTLFLLLLSYALLLFGAGGLVIPNEASRHPEGLRAYFEADGRAGVVLLSVYGLIAPFANFVVFGNPLLTGLNGVVIGWSILGVSIVLLESRRAYVWHVLVWGGLGALVFVRSSPRAY